MLVKRLHQVALLAAALILYGTLCSNAQAQPWPQRWNDEGEADDVGECIAHDKRGNVIVAGKTKNWNSTWDVQVLKYSSTGALLWERHYDGTGDGDDYATAIHVDDGLNVYVVWRLHNQLRLLRVEAGFGRRIRVAHLGQWLRLGDG